MRHVRYIAGTISIALLLNISCCVGKGCCSTKAVSPVANAEKIGCVKWATI